MKKIVFIILLATLCLAGTAQINQVASISNEIMFSGADANKYYTYTPNGNTIFIYNWNGSLYKTIIITPPSGYTVYYVYCLSKKVINNDEKLEMCVFFHSSTVDNSYSKMWLINEDGTKLNDFGNAASFSANYDVYNGEKHLIIKKTLINPTSYTTVIYSCSGSGSVSIAQPNNTELGAAFPNPTSSMVTLPYHLSSSNNTAKMHIYDMSGKLVKTISVGPHFSEVMVDVSSFPSGMYIYECEGKTSKFVVK
jgi:hypothetical protein